MRMPVIWISLMILWLAGPTGTQAKKLKIFVVSSYHREYLWSQDTNQGLCAGLLELGFLNNAGQAAEFTRTDRAESAACVVQKAWMDTKRKGSPHEMAVATNRVMAEIAEFAPDLVLLGDDNAANYIGNQLIDTKTPVVFWGVNGLPLKYGLLDSLERPGHNVTGVYQSGYLRECLEFLRRLAPDVRTFAILADDSETGRSKAKAMESLANAGVLPLQLLGSVVTNDLEQWKAETLAWNDKVDAFFVTNHNTLKDKDGRVVDALEVGAWYLTTIRKPECSDEKQFAQEGMLCVCDDSGYNQGYEAMKLASRILQKGEHPRAIVVKAPPRGPFVVNRQRARMLGIDLKQGAGTEEYLDKSLALARSDR